MKVPLQVFRTASFQSWYRNLKKGKGNRLDDSKLEMEISLKDKNGDLFVFFWALKVNIWLEKEQRFKNNEVVFCR